jgi:hypothetical protein
VHIGEFTLDQIPAAHHALSEHHLGKPAIAGPGGFATFSAIYAVNVAHPSQSVERAGELAWELRTSAAARRVAGNADDHAPQR